MPRTPPSIIIACRVFRAEIAHILTRMRDAPPVRFLDQGLHETPAKLKIALQAAIDAAEAEEAPAAIILAYGLCGMGLAGVTARKAALIIPRVHDCIPLLLGRPHPESLITSENSGTYWLSPGWLECSQIPFITTRPERETAYAAKFGQAAAAYLMEQERKWLAGYSRACYIRWPDLPGYRIREARVVAEESGLPYTERVGDSDYLASLLRGGEDRERFLRLPPGHTVALLPDGCICSVKV